MTDATLKEKAPLCNGVTEFVMSINMPFGKTRYNTGVLVDCEIPMGENIEPKTRHENYFFINMIDFGSFIDIDTINDIRGGIIAPKGPDDLKNRLLKYPHIRVVKADRAVTKDLIDNDVVGSYIVAINLFGIFKPLLPRMDYRNFSSRVHVRLTATPAGLGSPKGIRLVRSTTAPHLATKVVDDFKFLLVDFHSSRHELIVAKESDPLNYISADADEFMFVDDCNAEGSSITDHFVKMFGLYESMCARNLQLAKIINDQIKPPAPGRPSTNTSTPEPTTPPPPPTAEVKPIKIKQTRGRSSKKK